jgi:hypothetical protein
MQLIFPVPTPIDALRGSVLTSVRAAASDVIYVIVTWPPNRPMVRDIKAMGVVGGRVYCPRAFTIFVIIIPFLFACQSVARAVAQGHRDKNIL